MAASDSSVADPPAADTPADKPRKARPVYLDLIRIRQPVPAIVSILHRVSGAVLFLIGIPLMLWAVQQSLRSPDDFARLRQWMAQPLLKLVLIGLLWAYLHHLFAGIRHLLLDLHYGLELKATRQSSIVVLVAALALTVIIGIKLW